MTCRVIRFTRHWRPSSTCTDEPGIALCMQSRPLSRGAACFSLGRRPGVPRTERGLASHAGAPASARHVPWCLASPSPRSPRSPSTSHGFPVQHVSLNDGGIWVTNNSIGAVGRFTKPIGAARRSGRAATTASPASTCGRTARSSPPTTRAAGGSTRSTSTSTAFSDAGAAISPRRPAASRSAASTLAVLGAPTTRCGPRRSSAGGGSLAALAAAARPLAAHLPADAAVAVGTDDTVWVAGGGQLRGFPQGGKPPTSPACRCSATDPLQVTTVGDVPVVADTTTKTLYLPDSGHTVPLPAADTSTGLRAAAVVGGERRRGRRHRPGAVQRRPGYRPAHHAQHRAQRHRRRPGPGRRAASTPPGTTAPPAATSAAAARRRRPTSTRAAVLARRLRGHSVARLPGQQRRGRAQRHHRRRRLPRRHDRHQRPAEVARRPTPRATSSNQTQTYRSRSRRR